LNKPEDFRGICVFLSEFDHLTMEGFPLSILQWISLTKPRLYNHHYCHVYSPKHGTHIVVAITLNAKNHQTLTDHTRLRFHVKFPECASINHPLFSHGSGISIHFYGLIKTGIKIIISGCTLW
jgi:hypothetical protein